jgi:hypothetical protein
MIRRPALFNCVYTRKICRWCAGKAKGYGCVAAVNHWSFSSACGRAPRLQKLWACTCFSIRIRVRIVVQKEHLHVQYHHNHFTFLFYFSERNFPCTFSRSVRYKMSRVSWLKFILNNFMNLFNGLVYPLLSLEPLNHSFLKCSFYFPNSSISSILYDQR